MQHGAMPVMRAAMDPIAFFVVAIIVFNIISALAKGLKKAVGGAASTADAAARQRLAQTLQNAPEQLAAARVAELAKLRQALLASAGVTTADTNASQSPVYTVATQAQSQAAQVASRAPATRPQPMRSAGLPPIVSSVPTAPTPMTPAGWLLQGAGALMTLESARTAFEQLAAPGSLAAATQAAAAARPAPGAPSLALLQLPNSGANLIVAAAIVGPCAAFRSIGHTPGGW